MAFPTKEQLTALVAPTLEPFGVELDGITVNKAGKKSRVLITVDGEKDVDLDALEQITQHISQLFDDAENTGELNFGAGYTLEVSTRGVDAPLVLPRHWAKNRSRLVRLEPGSAPVRLGALDDAGTRAITISAQRGKGAGNKTFEIQEVELAQYPQAMVEIEFSTPHEQEVALSKLSFDAAMDWREEHK